MKRFLRLLATGVAVTLTAFFIARTAIVSGLVQAGLETAIGREINLTLREFFGIAGAEEGETLIISVVFITSLILAIVFFGTISALIKKPLQRSLNK